MIRRSRELALTAFAMAFCLTACSPGGDNATGGDAASSSETPSALAMPADWKVVSDFLVPADQVQPMSASLGAELSSVRNTVYDVGGKRVQVNVMIVPDASNGDKLMTKLLTIKGAEFFLRKDLVVYEFVGTNDVLPEIAEGRKHLDSM